MLIGEDFDKIEFTFLGLDLVEPNAMIGDGIVFILSLYLSFRVKKLDFKEPFYKYWHWFFLVFGVCFLFGGLGHMMYNYWSIKGKYIGWFSNIIAVFLAEQAMLSLHPNSKLRATFKTISQIKAIVVLVAMVVMFSSFDFSADEQKGLIIPAANSFVGLFSSIGILGYYYSNKLDSNFKYFVFSILVTIPSAFFQGLKINIHPWLDRNDVTHILLIATLLLYFTAVKRVKISFN